MPGSPVAVRAVACLTVASSRTAHVALCGQLMSRRAWYHEPTAAMATEPLQLLDLGCGLTASPAVQSRHQLRTVQTTAEGSSLRER